MEIVLFLALGLFGILIMFLIVEQPYYIVGLLIFVVHYNYNLALPGPLDLRGMLTLLLFVRLIVFDKKNLQAIINFLLRNKIFLLLMLFILMFIIVSYIYAEDYKTPIRMAVYQVISISLGFLTIYNGFGKRAFLIGIIGAGLFSTLDLGHHYLTQTGFHITRVLDMALKSEYSTDFNHNFFGMLIGVAFVTVYIQIISKEINKIIGSALLFIFGLGLMFSTSRGSMLALFIALLVGSLLVPKNLLDIRKIIKVGISSFFIFLLVLISFSIGLKALNIKSDFADKIYYRLLEEPLEILHVKKNKSFTDKGEISKGTIEWRMEQAERDIDKFLTLTAEVQLFGYGEGGYFKIGEIEWIKGRKFHQTISHNGYVLLTIEKGIIGLSLLMIILLSSIVISIKAFRDQHNSFPFFIILIFYMVFTYGAQDQLLDRFGYIMFGGIIGQNVLYKYSVDEEESIYDES